MSFNTDQFNKQAKTFHVEYAKVRDDLERCLESRQNEDINFICQRERADYLQAIAMTFCKPDYDIGVKCQKDAGLQWASKCFQQNVRFGQCADAALRKLYIYNLENNPKKPQPDGS
jgi:hypothetical protein